MRISGLGDRPLHATPLYSIIGNAAISPILLRLWFGEVPMAFVVGVYLILAGLGRFVEERFRGEPNQWVVAGLPFHQWCALAGILLGAGVAVLGSNPPPPGLHLDPWIGGGAVAAGVVAGFAARRVFPLSRTSVAHRPGRCDLGTTR